MAKFNVGDKVRFIEKFGEYSKGDEVTIKSFIDTDHVKFEGEHGVGDAYTRRLELVKTTKNQRITVLENEVAELKLIVHELRGKKSIEPSAPTEEDIIEFEGKQYRKVDRLALEGDVVIIRKPADNNRFARLNTPYKVVVDEHQRLCINNPDDALVYNNILGRTSKTVEVYELIQSKPLTPNQQRAAIIEKAKNFVEDNKTEITGEALYSKHKGTVNTWRNIYVFANKAGKHACNVEFVVDAEKRTITALMRGVDTNNIYEEATAKCSPNDVFNEHIGKAIALGRALGLDVSEFEQAVQPNEVVVGQIVDIINDTNAIY